MFKESDFLVSVGGALKGGIGIRLNNGRWVYWSLVSGWNPVAHLGDLKKSHIEKHAQIALDIIAVELGVLVVISRGHRNRVLPVYSGNQSVVDFYNAPQKTKSATLGTPGLYIVICASVERVILALKQSNLEMRIERITSRLNRADAISKGTSLQPALRVDEDYSLPPEISSHFLRG